MDLSEALPFLQQNHLSVVTTIGPSGRPQSTVVSVALHEGKLAFVSRQRTMKVKNVRRSGRCSVTVINPANTRYVTIEGPATAHGMDDSSEDAWLALLRATYTASGRPPDRWDDFDRSMREELRNVVLITPERVYGSL